MVDQPKRYQLIDSAYGHRDAGLAQRGQLVLNKVWQHGMQTVNSVMNADDSQLAAEMEGWEWRVEERHQTRETFACDEIRERSLSLRPCHTSRTVTGCRTAWSHAPVAFSFEKKA